MNKMEPSEIRSFLERRQEQYESCDVKDALNAPVESDMFYQFVASISNLSVGHRGDSVEVSFKEPVPGATDLESGYTYTIEVGREGSNLEGHRRCEMPKAELLTLQQVAITIWALATGEIY